MSAPAEKLAETLQNLAIQLDDELSRPENMAVRKEYNAARDALNPPHVEMSPEAAATAEKQGWYMPDAAVIARLDELGTTQIHLLDGSVITRKAGKLFSNPCGATGLTGPGVLGVFKTSAGPSPESRAVDIIPYFSGDDNRLSFYGITRSPADGSKPAFNGGFNEGAAFQNAVREFIEESIAASALPLMQQDPEGRELLAAWRKATAEVSEDDRTLLAKFGIKSGFDESETISHWLQKSRPQLVQDITELFQRNKLEIYKGPVRADPRNTDTRWIATEAFACFIPQNEMADVLSRHGLALKGGSDAASTATYGFDANFALKAYASHGPILLRAFAEILRHNPALPDAVHAQARELIDSVAEHLAHRAQPNNVHAKMSGVSGIETPPI